MKKIILIFVFVFTTFFIYSQNEIVKIREAYSDAQKNIAMQQDKNIPSNNISFKLLQNLPGIGQQEVNVFMYFSQAEYDKMSELNFVRQSYNVASENFYNEFLYDEKGNLIFSYSRYFDYDDGNTYEMRLYFSNENLIKILVKVLKQGGKEKNTSDYVLEYDNTKITPKYQTPYNNAIAMGKSMKEKFITLVQIL